MAASIDWRTAAIIACLSAGIIWQREYIMHAAQNVASVISMPYLWTSQAISRPISRWRQRRRATDELIRTINAQDERIRTLFSETVSLQGYMRHHNLTQDLQTYLSHYDTSYAMLAHMTGISRTQDGHLCWLDVGSRRGITRDMIAVAYNTIVGRVFEVYPFTSCVLLMTDPRSKIPAVGLQSGTKGICEGNGDISACSLSFVSHLDPLHEGELVTASGEGSIYPQGFALGTITEAVLDRNALTYHVNVTPALDVDKLTHCYVIQKGSCYRKPAIDAAKESEGLTEHAGIIAESNTLPGAP